jgi:RimJ/RimL family protein N-acetyltransferase
MTARVTLRPVAKTDFGVLYEHQRDPEATRMAAFPARDWAAFEAHWMTILSDPTVVARAIVEDGRVAGNVVMWGPPDERLVGYWIGREHWGRGIASAGLSLLLDEFPGRPLVAHVAKANVGSIRVLEKCGFKVSGENRVAVPAGAEVVEEWIMRLDR